MQRGDTLAQLPESRASVLQLRPWRQERLQLRRQLLALLAICCELLAGRRPFLDPMNGIVRLRRGLRGSKKHQCCRQARYDPLVFHFYPFRDLLHTGRVASASERAGLSLCMAAQGSPTPLSRPLQNHYFDNLPVRYSPNPSPLSTPPLFHLTEPVHFPHH